MGSLLQDIDRGIADLKAHLDAIRNLSPPRLPQQVGTYQREPGYRALTLLPGTHCMVLANLEILLSSGCQQLDPEASANRFGRSLTTGDSGYWTRGAIAQGIADLAVDLGLLHPAEKDRLLAKRTWEQEQFQIVDVVSELDDEIAFLGNVVARLKERLRPPSPEGD